MTVHIHIYDSSLDVWAKLGDGGATGANAVVEKLLQVKDVDIRVHATQRKLREALDATGVKEYKPCGCQTPRQVR